MLLSCLSVISYLVPDQFTSKIDGALVWAFSYIYALNGIINVEVIFDCISVLLKFFAGLLLFYVIRWVMKVTNE